MKIINAITHFPKTLRKVNKNKKLPLDDNRPIFSSDDLVLETTLPICKKLIKESKFNPLDIDLILNITLTPDRLFKDKTIGVPRVSHPIHYMIKAENAFVIDIHESDWNTAFTIAKSFMVDQDYKNVLIIRTEFLNSSVHPDYESGFNIPDGVSIILAQHEGNDISIDYQDLKTEDMFCRYDMIKKGEELVKGHFRSRLTFNAEAKYINDLNKTGQDFMNKMLKKYKVDGVIFESWFPQHNVRCNHADKVFKSIKKDDAFKSLGVFSLPYYLRELKEENNKVTTICNISYSPFLNRYSSMIVSV